MKVKVSEATGVVLDWMVAKAENKDVSIEWSSLIIRVPPLPGKRKPPPVTFWAPTNNWAQGGPIIEQATIQLSYQDNGKYAGQWGANWWHELESGNVVPRTQYGPTALIAAMRCYVAAKLGKRVEVPEELVPETK